MAKIELLLVEDDPVLRDLLSLVFEDEMDFSVHLVSNEKDAEAKIKEHAFHAVITDLQLGNQKGGLAVLRQAHERSIPSALMTADITHPDDYYLDLGADWVIRKPFDSQELPQIARRLASLND